MKTIHQKTIHGFALIEALVAMMIVSFGMLGIAGFQTTLSLNSDVAKQRTEATRLAQEKMEDLRTFSDLKITALIPEPDPAVSYPKKIINGTKTIEPSIDNPTNTTYTLNWKVLTQNPDTGRSINVVVTWNDRTGNNQKVQLLSHISASDPVLTGSLFFTSPDGNPKNRNLDIPIPSIDLGNGKSAVRFKDGGQYVLFNNITGDVTNTCNTTLTATASENIVKSTLKDPSTTNTGICSKIKGYIVAGYIDVSLETDSSTNGNGNNRNSGTTEWNTIKSSLNIDPLRITLTPTSNRPIECHFDDAKNQNTGASITDYKYYLCLISWPAPSNDSTDNQTYTWSGIVRLSGPTIWNSSNTKYYVCRFQYSAVGAFAEKTSDTQDEKDQKRNQRNVQAYVNVNKSIDQQNYFAAYTSGTPNCDGTKMNVTGVSTGVLHQNCKSEACPSPAN